MVRVIARGHRLAEDRRHVQGQRVLAVGAAAVRDLDRIDIAEVGVLGELRGREALFERRALAAVDGVEVLPERMSHD